MTLILGATLAQKGIKWTARLVVFYILDWLLKWSRLAAIRSLSLISCGCDRSLRNLLTKAAIERGKCRDRHFGMSAGPRALSSALKQSSQGLASAFRVIGRFNVDWNDLRWPVMTKGSVMTESPVCRRLL